MKYCPACGAQLEENDVMCKICGAPVQGETKKRDTYSPDHTGEFSQKDVSENKVYAILVYLVSIFGVIIALLAARDSEYLKFHVRQYVKFIVVEMLSFLALIVPLLGWIALPIWLCVLGVVKIVCFFRVCAGESIEPPILRDIGFLK